MKSALVVPTSLCIIFFVGIGRAKGNFKPLITYATYFSILQWISEAKQTIGKARGRLQAVVHTLRVILDFSTNQGRQASYDVRQAGYDTSFWQATTITVGRESDDDGWQKQAAKSNGRASGGLPTQASIN